MHIKTSLRQLYAESRANPGFTFLYLGGVAFAVAFTMVFAIIYYVNIAPIYPEYKRTTTYYLSNLKLQNDENNSIIMNGIGIPFVKQFIENSENVELCAVATYTDEFIQPDDRSGDFSVRVIWTNQDFFRLYDYEFLAGRPFNDAELTSTVKNVIIDSSLASRLFGSPQQAVGQEISLAFLPYRVIGVVRDGTPIAAKSFARVFAPYTLCPQYDLEREIEKSDKSHLMGMFGSALKFKDSEQAEKFRREINSAVDRFNSADTAGWKLGIQNGPISHTFKVLTQDSQEEDHTVWDSLRPLLLILLVLLIVPAINISGMISGQMDRRIAEIGVRRSFGATRRQLIRQVMSENLLLTITGGIIGLITAWIFIYFCRLWILQIILPAWESVSGEGSAVSITAEMLFSPLVFIATLAICLVLNLISAYIPVWFSLRRPIISSLNSNR